MIFAAVSNVLRENFGSIVDQCSSLLSFNELHQITKTINTMQPRSEQSVSPLHNERTTCKETDNTGRARRNNNATPNSSKPREGRGPSRNAPKVKEMLNKALAVLLVRVRIESSPETAEKILDVLRDDYFDLEDFQHTVTNMKKCEEITWTIVDNKQ